MVAAWSMGDADKKMIRMNFHLTPEQVEGLDLLRKDAGDLPSRAEVVRRLINKALAERAAKKPGD
jgi:Arc/MetJ-type ribon-helix-helix transcriptional regulator